MTLVTLVTLDSSSKPTASEAGNDKTIPEIITLCISTSHVYSWLRGGMALHALYGRGNDSKTIQFGSSKPCDTRDIRLVCHECHVPNLYQRNRLPNAQD